MNKHMLPLLSAAFASTAALAVPEVSNVVFTQPPEGGKATISYSLQNGPAVITVDIRTNGVSIGEQNFANVSGDVNCKVSGDTAHQISWKPHKSWPGHAFSGGVDAVVTAWSLDNPPDYMVVDLANENAAPRYYVSTNALPGGLFGNDVYRTSMLVMRKIAAADVPWTMCAGNVPHAVTLDADYYIGVFEFTQGQYYTLFGDWPSGEASDRELRLQLDTRVGLQLADSTGRGYAPRKASQGHGHRLRPADRSAVGVCLPCRKPSGDLGRWQPVSRRHDRREPRPPGPVQVERRLFAGRYGSADVRDARRRGRDGLSRVVRAELLGAL